MKKTRMRKSIRRVDMQVSIFTAVMVIVSCFTLFYYHYHLTYANMIESLSSRVRSLSDYVESHLDQRTFTEIVDHSDMNTPLYHTYQALLNSARRATGVRYLYTATKTDDGRYIYLLDGLDLDAADFRRPGDAIEPEITSELDRAMSGECVLPSDIKATDWGKIFIAYMPVHSGGQVIGVVGIEFEAESQYNTYQNLLYFTPMVILAACILAALFALYFFRRISNPTFRDLSTMDALTQLKNRNAFDVDLENLNASHNKKGICILVADLNYLKKVNDTLGHQSGDEYIQLAADVLRNLNSDHTTAYRIGGDEFSVLLIGMSHESMEPVIRSMEASFESRKPDWNINTAISIGYALFDSGQDRSLHDTFHRADEMMYHVKYESKH